VIKLFGYQIKSCEAFRFIFGFFERFIVVFQTDWVRSRTKGT
jgi:hypothetical protein